MCDCPPPMVIGPPNAQQPWPPGFAPPNAPHGVIIMNGVTYARPEPVRWICSKRTTKLMYFLCVALLAAITIIVLFAFPFPQTGVLIMGIIIILVTAADYLIFGYDCSVDPLVGKMNCPNIPKS